MSTVRSYWSTEDCLSIYNERLSRPKSVSKKSTTIPQPISLSIRREKTKYHKEVLVVKMNGG